MKRLGLRRSNRGNVGPGPKPDLDEFSRTDRQLDAVRRSGGADSDDPVLGMLGALAADVDADETPAAPSGERARPRRRMYRPAAAAGLAVAACVAAAVVVAGAVGPVQPFGPARDGSGEVAAVASVEGIRASLSRARGALAAGHVNEAQHALQRAQAGWAALDERQTSEHPALGRELRSVQADLALAKRAPGRSGPAAPAAGGDARNPAEGPSEGEQDAGNPAEGSPEGARGPVEAPTGKPAPTAPADDGSGNEPGPAPRPLPTQPGDAPLPGDGRGLPGEERGLPGDGRDLPDGSEDLPGNGTDRPVHGAPFGDGESQPGGEL